MKIEETYVDGILIINHITEESDLSTQEQKNNWISICNICEYKENDICKSCGCIILTIMSNKTSSCPINKW